MGARLRGRTATQRSEKGSEKGSEKVLGRVPEKGSEKVLGRVPEKGSQKGSEKWSFYGFYSRKGF